MRFKICVFPWCYQGFRKVGLLHNEVEDDALIKDTIFYIRQDTPTSAIMHYQTYSNRSDYGASEIWLVPQKGVWFPRTAPSALPYRANPRVTVVPSPSTGTEVTTLLTTLRDWGAPPGPPRPLRYYIGTACIRLGAVRVNHRWWTWLVEQGLRVRS